MIDLQREEEVFVLRLDDNENRFSPAFLDGLSAALDTVEAAEGPRALVTVGTGKFYSNGLDLGWVSQDAERWGPYLDRIHRLYARVLRLPMPTVAAVNGHAFAGGGMLALAHDFRVMRADRGYFCLPEVDLGLGFSPAMAALIQARLPLNTAHEAMVTGRRYGGEEARDAGIVQQTAAEDQVLPAAIAIGAPLAAKNGTVMAQIRTAMYAPALALLAP